MSHWVIPSDERPRKPESFSIKNKRPGAEPGLFNIGGPGDAFGNSRPDYFIFNNCIDRLW